MNNENIQQPNGNSDASGGARHPARTRFKKPQNTSFNPNFYRENRPYKPSARDKDGNYNPPNRSYNKEGNYGEKSYNSDTNNRNYGNYSRTDRPQRNYNNSEGRPQRDYNNHNSEQRPQRDYNNYNSEQRPQRNYNNYNSEQRPQRDYNNYNSEQRPRSDYNNSEGGYQQRKSYNDSGNRQNFNNRYQNNGASNQNQGENFRKPNDKFKKGGTYNPNAKYGKKKQFEYKQQFIDYSQPMRLNKFLANSSTCSRREADEFIVAGVISVNGEIVKELGTKIIPETDKVYFHDQPVTLEKKVYVLLNKPKNCVTTSDDPEERLTVLDLVKNACKERIYPVGRLDRNTTGVMLLTNDGDLTSKLTHPKYDKKKIYQVSLDRDFEQEDLQKLLDGITLEDGEIKADEISYVKEDDLKIVGVEVHSGKNRIVRRMFEHLGYKVKQLDRVYFAGLTKKKLPRGKWRFLSAAEVNMLKMTS